MYRTILICLANLLISPGAALGHEGHSAMGTINHELEHGLWFVAALAFGASLVMGYKWLSSRK